jgi:hypothetical protein
MKRYLFLMLFCLFLSSSLFAMGRIGDNKHHRNNNQRHGETNNHPGGSGVPEPVSMLLILGGGAAAYGIKKAIKK